MTQQQGFFLTETMISLAVVGVALVGLCGLLNRLLADARVTHETAVATALAQEFAALWVLANRPPILTGQDLHATHPVTAPPACQGPPGCDIETQFLVDREAWRLRADNLLPGFKASFCAQGPKDSPSLATEVCADIKGPGLLLRWSTPDLRGYGNDHLVKLLP